MTFAFFTPRKIKASFLEYRGINVCLPHTCDDKMGRRKVERKNEGKRGRDYIFET